MPDFDVTEEMYLAGRIAGLREAAEICEWDEHEEASRYTLARVINAAADKLESAS